MARVRIARAALYALLLSLATVVGWRGRDRRARHLPAPERVTTGSPVDATSGETRVRQRGRLRARRGLVVIVVVVSLIAAAVSFWALDGAWRVVALVVVGLVNAVLAIWKFPQWQAEAVLPHGDKKEQFELENEARKTLGGALSGLAIVFTLAFTWQQLADSRQEAANEQALTREGQVTGRFTAAVAQLSDPSLQIRLGGIYALERIARDSKVDAPTVLEVLTAFVREPRPQETATPVLDELGRVQAPADVQAVLTVIEREQWAAQWLPKDKDSEWLDLGLRCLDLGGSDLRGARVVGTDLVRMCLNGADLRGASLVGDLWEAVLWGARLGCLEGSALRRQCAHVAGDLREADLGNADLRGADLSNADLRGAYLGFALLQGADLAGTDLRGAVLWGAHLECLQFEGDRLQCTDMAEAKLGCAELVSKGGQVGPLVGRGDGVECADLSSADLAGADLRSADLDHANLRGADLTGTVLVDARNLTQPQIDSATWSDDSPPQLPPHLMATPGPSSSGP